MKTLILILINLNVFAQGYVGFGAQNQGLNFNSGVLINKIDIRLHYKTNVMSNVKPSIFSLNLGRQINITQKVYDNYSITPFAGIAIVKSKDFNAFDKNPTNNIEIINKIQPIFSLEFGKDAYYGRMLTMIQYCEKFYYGIGIRAFFPKRIIE